jgi:hypothetical protein
MRSCFKKGQSIFEVTVLICIILSALLIMQFYIKRGYQGRIKQEIDDLGPQYSPGHTTSVLVTGITTVSNTSTGGSITSPLSGNTIEVQDGMTVTISRTSTTSEKKEEIGSLRRED